MHDYKHTYKEAAMRPEDSYQLLLHIVLAGCSTVAIKKGVDFLTFVVETVAKMAAAWVLWVHGQPVPDDFPKMDVPKLVQRGLGLIISLVVPPAAYAILLVDSGLVRFSFAGIVGVTGAAMVSAWGWYEYQRAGSRGRVEG